MTNKPGGGVRVAEPQGVHEGGEALDVTHHGGFLAGAGVVLPQELQEGRVTHHGREYERRAAVVVRHRHGAHALLLREVFQHQGDVAECGVVLRLAEEALLGALHQELANPQCPAPPVRQAAVAGLMAEALSRQLVGAPLYAARLVWIGEVSHVGVHIAQLWQNRTHDQLPVGLAVNAALQVRRVRRALAAVAHGAVVTVRLRSGAWLRCGARRAGDGQRAGPGAEEACRAYVAIVAKQSADVSASTHALAGDGPRGELSGRA
mmetsp:Transcript_86870/g.268987  ORF Transcript_86870/g.268987 Transcript_86870/m.268987 type:complete len:263 (+) Transcript_86870:237-1025(+)